jgi:hypothetical protein
MKSAVHTTSSSAPEAVRPTGYFSSMARHLFSFPVMCIFLLAAVIFGFCVKQFAEPDIWWHLRYARDLVQYHTFFPTHAYSFTTVENLRANFEWLSEVLYFFAFRAAGLPGILAVYSAALLLIYAGVYYRSCVSGADCKDATVATLIGIFLGVVSIGPRTLLFGWVCMIGLLLVLDHFQRTGKGLWLLPPLFALWVNLHPSWIFGIVVVVLTIGSGLIEGEWGIVLARKWNAAELTKLMLALIASLGMLFLNPFGYKLALYPFEFLFQQGSMMQAIEEWRGVDLSTGNGKLTLLVILGMLAAATFSRRRWRLDEVLLAVFALWSGLSHGRLLFFVGLVIPPLLAPRINLFPPYDRELDKPWLNAIIMGCVLGSLVWLFPSGLNLQRRVDESYPTAVLDFMHRQNLKGRIFNQYSWGGYMEWTAPDLKPFIDGRADIFVTNGVLNDHRNAMVIEKPLEILDKYRIDYVLIQPQGPLAYLLEHSPGWRCTYADNLAVLFQRTPGVGATATPSGFNPN